jgi:Reverse transcriptase (RNA-dependent DNA polymerase)
MNRAYYPLKLMLLLDTGRFLSGPPIHAKVPSRPQNFTKLHNLGIQGLELKWFENYLPGRKQFVVINGKARLREIILGVPQGSILGPLLFIIYVNNLAKASDLFADNTKLLVRNLNPKTLNYFVNNEFYKINTYFRAH